MPRKQRPRAGLGAPHLVERLAQFAAVDLDDLNSRYGSHAFLEHAIRERHSGFGNDLPAGADEQERANRLRRVREEHAKDLEQIRRLQVAVCGALRAVERARLWRDVRDEFLPVFVELAEAGHVTIVRKRNYGMKLLARDEQEQREQERSPHRIRNFDDGSQECTWVKAGNLFGPGSEDYGLVCLDAIEWLDQSGRCVVCGTLLDPESNVNKKYCSDICRQAHAKKKPPPPK